MYATYPPPPPPPPPPPDHPEDLKEAVEKGSQCFSKHFCRTTNEVNPLFHTWVESKSLPSYPCSIGTSETTTRSREACAICLYHSEDPNNSKYTVVSVHINSKALQSLLKQVLEGYPGLTEHNLTSFAPPFLPLFHHWKDLSRLEGTQHLEGEGIGHLRLLLRELEPLLEESFETLRGIEATDHVAFEDLALVFVPGTIVIRHNLQSAGILRSYYYGKHKELQAFLIDVDVVDWDGKRYGLLPHTWAVYKFPGLRQLTVLPVTPLSRMPDALQIRHDLIKRGREFERYRGNDFSAYANPSCNRLHERVVINARAYHTFNSHFPKFRSLTESGRLTWSQSMARNAHNLREAVPHIQKTDLAPLTDDQCLLTMPTVKCYNFGTKAWELLEISKLQCIQWADNAFSRLVLGQEKKDLLLAFLNPLCPKKDKVFEDLVAGKGQGTTILLSGPPGVGKTLTAEAVAEHSHRPLYKLEAAELGTDPTSVNFSLDKYMRQCAELGAILLIDEADVFLQARSAHNLLGNGLVTVFLQKLEHYQGVLFLTTNRMSDFDKAVESRIDLPLVYTPLSKEDREQIWATFLSSLNAENLNICALSEHELNGREIKSAVKTALTLAAYESKPLAYSHLKLAVDVRIPQSKQDAKPVDII